MPLLVPDHSAIDPSALDTLRAIAEQAILAPRPCVGCTTLGAAECASCYTRLYPGTPAPSPAESGQGEGEAQ